MPARGCCVTRPRLSPSPIRHGHAPRHRRARRRGSVRRARPGVRRRAHRRAQVRRRGSSWSCRTTRSGVVLCRPVTQLQRIGDHSIPQPGRSSAQVAAAHKQSRRIRRVGRVWLVDDEQHRASRRAPCPRPIHGINGDPPRALFVRLTPRIATPSSSASRMSGPSARRTFVSSLPSSSPARNKLSGSSTTSRTPSRRPRRSARAVSARCRPHSRPARGPGQPRRARARGTIVERTRSLAAQDQRCGRKPV